MHAHLLTMNLDEIFACYPGVRTVFETSDGLRHLSMEEAEAQASHLADKAIAKHHRQRGKNNDADAAPATT